jgi:alkanesulfonate monooxygenase SsuD/methylene tetrahydromethanopterin reductase-like flavin-dependent oxidoreductase (luciferase family)
MGTPAQLAAGIERLTAYAREAGRNAAELDIIYRTHDYALHSDDRATGSAHHRHPFVGTAAEIALDIRQYEGLGVGYLVLDLARMSRTLEEMLQHMEAMATQVWPRVEAGEE